MTHTFRLSDHDVRDLRAFLAVVEFGGVTSAASELGVSLTSLSRSLSTLETRFGIRLCNRGRAGFSLTPAGREVFEATRQFLENVTEFEHSMHAVARAARGKLRIGIIDNTLSNPSSPVVEALHALIVRWQEIYLDLVILPKPSIEAQVREGKIDVGITGDPLLFRSLTYSMITEEEHHLYVARGSVIAQQIESGARLSSVPYVRRRYKASIFEAFEQRYDLAASATAGSLEAVAMLVASSAGIGILPTHYVEAMPHLDLQPVPMPGGSIKTPFYAVYRSLHSLAPLTRSFVQLLAPDREGDGGSDVISIDAHKASRGARKLKARFSNG